MTPEQKKNLLNHADFLETVVPNQPEERKFNMVHWVEYDEETGPAHLRPSYFVKEKPCGFSACALGWGPLNLNLPEPKTGESWEQYGHRIFGLDPNCDDEWWDDEEAYASHNGFYYCFDSSWDDDPIKAAQRMREVAEELG